MENVKSVTGVDIDPDLIAKARRAAKKRIQKETSKHAEADQFIPLSCTVVQGVGKDQDSDRSDIGTAEGVLKAKRPHFHRGYPYNLFYRCEDFAAEVPARTAKEKQAYDVVLCLSVTKWVHMHSGDEGLKRLFYRMYECLKPNGVLVLEPQPVRSYKKVRQKKIDGLQKSFADELTLKPAMFKEHLLTEVGFERFEMLRNVKEKGHSFNRPVMAFFKPGQEEGATQGDNTGLEVSNGSTNFVSRIIEDVLEEVVGAKIGTKAQGIAQIIEQVFEQATLTKSIAEARAVRSNEDGTRRGKRKRQSHAKAKRADVMSSIKRQRKDSTSHVCSVDPAVIIDVDALPDDTMNTDVKTIAAMQRRGMQMNAAAQRVDEADTDDRKRVTVEVVRGILKESPGSKSSDAVWGTTQIIEQIFERATGGRPMAVSQSVIDDEDIIQYGVKRRRQALVDAEVGSILRATKRIHGKDNDPHFCVIDVDAVIDVNASTGDAGDASIQTARLESQKGDGVGDHSTNVKLMCAANAQDIKTWGDGKAETIPTSNHRSILVKKDFIDLTKDAADIDVGELNPSFPNIEMMIANNVKPCEGQQGGSRKPL